MSPTPMQGNAGSTMSSIQLTRKDTFQIEEPADQPQSHRRQKKKKSSGKPMAAAAPAPAITCKPVVERIIPRLEQADPQMLQRLRLAIQDVDSFAALLFKGSDKAVEVVVRQLVAQ